MKQIRFICFNSKTKQEEVHWFPKWVTIGGIYGQWNELTILSKFTPHKKQIK